MGRSHKAGLPHGSKCLECFNVVGRGFSTFNWEEVVSKAATSEDFKEKLKSAIASYRGEQKKFALQQFYEDTSVQVVTKRRMQFISTSEWDQHFPGTKPQDLGLTEIKLRIETGEQMGVLMASSSHPVREVEIVTTTGTCLETHIQERSNQLRPLQGTGLEGVYRTDRHSPSSRALRK